MAGGMFVTTMTDVWGALRGALVFALVLLLPGYCLWRLAVPRGRWDERLCWAVVISFCVVPIGCVLLAGATSLGLTCLVMEVVGVVGAGLMAWDLVQERPRWSRAATAVATGVLVWAVFVVGELVDVGVGQRLYMSVTVYDHALRTAFVDAVMRTGVPPLNPLYCADARGPGHCAPMHYYYFWYVLCAVVARVGQVTARQAMMASCVWGGVGLLAVLRLFCLHFWTGLRRWTVVVVLLAVTGLDLVPVLAHYLSGGATDADMEWWAVDQVSSWLDTLLWVPHHVAALVCCLTAFLLVWRTGQESGRGRRRVGAVLLGGAGCASAFGLSTYVALGFALTVMLWAMWAWVWERGLRGRVGLLAVTGMVGVVLLVPFVRELGRPAMAGKVKTGPPLRLQVREIIDPAELEGAAGLRRLRAWRPGAEREAVAALLLVPGYCAELGLFAGALVWAVWRMRSRGGSEAARTCVAMCVAGLVVVSVIRSNAIRTNDFGIRASLVPQFFLLLLGAEWWEARSSGPRWMRWVVSVLALVGVGGTVYQAVELRTYLAVEDRRGVARFAGLAERQGALRRALDAAGGVRPEGAVLQYNGDQPSGWFRFAELLGAGGQVADANPGCDTPFGGDRSFCEQMEDAERRLFDGRRALSAEEARKECGRLGATELMATRWDAVWERAGDWVWTLPVISATAEVRTVGCSPSIAGAGGD